MTCGQYDEVKLRYAAPPPAGGVKRALAEGAEDAEKCKAYEEKRRR
jgi:hypothetical protein